MSQTFPRDIQILHAVFSHSETTPAVVVRHLDGPETYVRRRLETVVDSGLLERTGGPSGQIRYETAPPGKATLEAQGLLESEQRSSL